VLPSLDVFSYPTECWGSVRTRRPKTSIFAELSRLPRTVFNRQLQIGVASTTTTHAMLQFACLPARTHFKSASQTCTVVHVLSRVTQTQRSARVAPHFSHQSAAPLAEGLLPTVGTAPSSGHSSSGCGVRDSSQTGPLRAPATSSAASPSPGHQGRPLRSNHNALTGSTSQPRFGDVLNARDLRY